jgi:hypothetical protein
MGCFYLKCEQQQKDKNKICSQNIFLHSVISINTSKTFQYFYFIKAYFSQKTCENNEIIYTYIASQMAWFQDMTLYLLYTQSKGDKSNKTISLSHHIYHINFEFTEI